MSRPRTAYIKNIRYVGQTTVEFLVTSGYADRFCQRFEEYATHFTVIKNYNLVTNPWNDPSSEKETREKTIRVTQKLIRDSNKSNDNTVHEFFKTLILSLGPIAKKEFQKTEKAVATKSVVTSAENVGEKDLISTIRQGHMAERGEESFSTKDSSATSQEVKLIHNTDAILKDKLIKKRISTSINGTTTSDDESQEDKMKTLDQFYKEQETLNVKKFKANTTVNPLLTNDTDTEMNKGSLSPKLGLCNDRPGDSIQDFFSTKKQSHLAKQSEKTFSTNVSSPKSSSVNYPHTSNDLYINNLPNCPETPESNDSLEAKNNSDLINF